MTRVWWTHLSYMGDMAVLLPCMLVISAWMAFWCRSSLVGWLLSMLTVGGVVVTTKLVYMAWGIGVPSLNFIGVSGHSAFSALVWPVVFGMVFDQQSPRGRFWGAALGFILASQVGLSRLELRVHSIAEVTIGFLLGFSVALVFLRRGGVGRQESAGRLWLLLSVTLAIVPGYGMRFPSEYLLRLIAERVSLNGHVHLRQLLDRPR